eukprot:3500369-Alexandrium_andersonii.AAC.1
MCNSASGHFGTAPNCPEQFRAPSDTFGRFRSAFGRSPALPESARKRPKVPESARNCSEQFRA